MRILLAVIVVTWVAHVPSSLWGQTWQSCGNNACLPTGLAGIGTTSPSGMLHVVGQYQIFYDRPQEGAATAHFILRKSNGTATSPTAVLANNPLGRISFQGYDGTQWTTLNSQGIYMAASQNWTSTAQGGYMVFLTTADGATAASERIRITSAGDVGIGTAAPQYRLAVNGTIGAKEVVVTNSGWADHVLRPGYRLPQLGDVGAYIRQHRRLPEIPSEKEVREKGIRVGEIQVKLLAKIEELTLYMIAAHESNNRLEQENRELQERIARLERAIQPR